MESYETRLATFKGRWPHKDTANFKVQPESLAQAGFYFRAIVGSTDNVACYRCNKNLDGWESTDDAWQEHCSHAPHCPLVRLDLLENRLSSFEEGGWPWLKRRGWKRSSFSHNGAHGFVKKMAEAGFYYYPQEAGDDSASCFQCGLMLDGWEATDIPRHEHERRRPRCPFLVGGAGLKPMSFDLVLGSRPDNSIKEIPEDSKEDHGSDEKARTKAFKVPAVPKNKRKAEALDMARPILVAAPTKISKRPTARPVTSLPFDEKTSFSTSAPSPVLSIPEIPDAELVKLTDGLVSAKELDMTVGQLLEKWSDTLKVAMKLKIAQKLQDFDRLAVNASAL